VKDLGEAPVEEKGDRLLSCFLVGLRRSSGAGLLDEGDLEG
jgi:hypothetical protein